MRKIVFYLMNKKGYTVLHEFLKKFGAIHIEYIVLSEDESVQKDYYLEIKDLCLKYDLIYYNRDSDLPKFDGYKFAVGWRWLIRDVSNLIVLHDSILPKYRGFAPLVNMLINGEKEIGVTALFASDDYDKGDIISQQKLTIEYPLKIEKAISMVSVLYFELVKDICARIFSDLPICSCKQNENEASYSLWRDESDYYIDWKDSSERIKRIVDAVGFPYLGAKSYLNSKLITINDVELVNDLKIENRDVGKVVYFDESLPIIVCGTGLIKIINAQTDDGESIVPMKKFRSRFV